MFLKLSPSCGSPMQMQRFLMFCVFFHLSKGKNYSAASSNRAL